MKKVVVYLVAWPLYWVGEFFSQIMNGFGLARVYGARGTHVFYRPYNFCMVRSMLIEEWAGTTMIWRPAQSEEKTKDQVP